MPFVIGEDGIQIYSVHVLTGAVLQLYMQVFWFHVSVVVTVFALMHCKINLDSSPGS